MILNSSRLVLAVALGVMANGQGLPPFPQQQQQAGPTPAQVANAAYQKSLAVLQGVSPAPAAPSASR
jgi:hypothetical protein